MAHGTFPILAALALGIALVLPAPASAQQQAVPTAAARIQEHMEAVGGDGLRVGTVDRVEGQRVKLTRDDPAAGGRHHYLGLDSVAGVEGGKVRLSRTAEQAKQVWTTE